MSAITPPDGNPTPLTRFNVRVYGLWIRADRHLLVADELIQGQRILKFPGGGLEFGEGPEDGIRREWAEEVGVPIRQLAHFYTTAFFQRSAYNPADQLLSIYYTLSCDAQEPALAPEGEIQTWRWLPLAALQPTHLTLPVDQVVAGMLARAEAGHGPGPR